MVSLVATIRMRICSDSIADQLRISCAAQLRAAHKLVSGIIPDTSGNEFHNDHDEPSSNVIGTRSRKQFETILT